MPSATYTSAATTLVFAPVYGSPFVHDLDQGRRYGTHRGFPELREAGLCDAVHAPFRRYGLRARRPAREQAPSRNGLCAYAAVGQTVHGLRNASRARAGHRAAVRDPVRRGVRPAEHRLHQPHKRQLADGVGRDHARRGRCLRAEQPGHDHHAVHPVRRDEPRVGGRDAGAGAGRSARGRFVRPTRAAGCSSHLRHLRVDAIDAIGCADLRHA